MFYYSPGDGYILSFGTCMQDLEVDTEFCVLSMCLLVSCTDHSVGGKATVKTSDLELIVTILKSPCMSDLPVHEGLARIG